MSWRTSDESCPGTDVVTGMVTNRAVLNHQSQESWIEIISACSWAEELWIGKDSLFDSFSFQIPGKKAERTEEPESQFLKNWNRHSSSSKRWALGCVNSLPRRKWNDSLNFERTLWSAKLSIGIDVHPYVVINYYGDCDTLINTHTYELRLIDFTMVEGNKTHDSSEGYLFFRPSSGT